MQTLLLGLALIGSPVTANQAPFQPGNYPPAVPYVAPQAAPYAPVPGANPYAPTPAFPTPALTLPQFAAVFRPVPGLHKVVIIHPRTGQPVPVCFRLPHGCPEVNLGRRHIEFEYDDIDVEVEIRFRFRGTVDVDYDD